MDAQVLIFMIVLVSIIAFALLAGYFTDKNKKMLSKIFFMLMFIATICLVIQFGIIMNAFHQ